MTGKSKKAGKKELSEEDIAFQKKQAEDMKAMKGTEHLCHAGHRRARLTPICFAAAAQKLKKK